MSNNKTVLVTGATGKQGGAVARGLLERGFNVRAMTRKPDGDAAKELAKKGAQIVAGDLDNGESLVNALNGVWGVWAVQNTWEAGVEREEEQGHRLAKIARERNVQHFVYTSVGSAHRKTGIPHFENKFRVEETIRAAGFPSHVIIRPVFFMENLTSPWFLNDNKLQAAMKPTTSLQMIAVEDIGKIGVIAFERASELRGREIDIAGDAVTLPQVATTFSETMGKQIDFVELPIDAVRAQMADFAAMLEWFDSTGYNADIDGVQREFGVTFSRLSDWAKKNAR